MKNVYKLFFSSIIFSLSGCVTVPREELPNPNNIQIFNNDNKYFDLTPMSTYSDELNSNSDSLGNFSGAYTRIIIRSKLYSNVVFNKDNYNNISYKYTERDPITRFFLGRDYAINLSAKINIGSYNATFPLATIGHKSNKEGEHWSRHIQHDILNTPLFLVKADGSSSYPQIQISVNATNTFGSSAATEALGLAIQLAEAVSSPPTVLTRLTADTASKGAKAVDNAISKLFSSGLTESHWTDRDLRKLVGTADAPLNVVNILFKIPTSEKDFNQPHTPIGNWQIGLDYPRPSIFSDWKVCKNISIPPENNSTPPENNSTRPENNRCEQTIKKAKIKVIDEFNASAILNYKLVTSLPELSTIRAYFSQLDWYTTAIVSFYTKEDKKELEEITKTNFCKRIVNEITSLGLNSFDASLVLKAIYEGMPSNIPDYKGNAVCEKLIMPEKLN